MHMIQNPYYSVSIFETYATLADQGVLSSQEALWLANVQLCQRLGYALYIGDSSPSTTAWRLWRVM